MTKQQSLENKLNKLSDDGIGILLKSYFNKKYLIKVIMENVIIDDEKWSEEHCSRLLWVIKKLGIK